MKTFPEFVSENTQMWNLRPGDWVEVDGEADNHFNGDIGQVEKVSGTNHVIVKFVDGTKGIFRIGDLAASSKPHNLK